MIVKVRDNQSRYPDTRNLTVESSRKKGEITWAKRFYWSLCLSAEFFLAEIYLCMLASRDFTEMVI